MGADLSGDGGVLKRTLLAGNATAARPSPGAIAVVHFIAWLSNGTEIGSSRRGLPLEIRLGAEPSEAIKGWELAIPDMHPGEKALLTCTGAYAYGERGAPPLIPPDATLAFELDLISWRPAMPSGGTAAGISRRWIDKLVSLEEEGISMPTASANEMLHELVREENQAAAGDGSDFSPDAAAARVAAAQLADDDDADDGPNAGVPTANMRALRERGEALKRRNAAGAMNAKQPELEVVGGGLIGEPIVQELYRKERGASDRHTWVEGRNDLEVHVPLAPDDRSATVTLGRRAMRVQAAEFVLEGELVRDLDLEASSWLVQPASEEGPRSLYILLVKRDPKQERWGAVFEIDAPDKADPFNMGVQMHYDLPRSDEPSRP